MSRRDENECAWCAGRLNMDHCVIGKDWKVYCSKACAEAGEQLMDQDDPRRFMSHSSVSEYLSRLSVRP